MNPILYESTETDFASNGLGRLRDCISCIVTEERNGIYECDFEYPISASDFDQIQLGRIIGVTHDDSGDVQPFDIISSSKPIDGVVTFHCVHISYRQSYMTMNGGGINDLATALAFCKHATNLGNDGNPFDYWTDMTKSGYCAAIKLIPESVRAVLGGVEGSILDAYGGEYEWDKWTVKLWSARGQYRDFAIRYGVNMLDYTEETDASETWSSCIPYWTDGTEIVVGSKQNSGGSTITGRDQCIPLDVSEKFEEKPTVAQVEAAARSYMSSKVPYLPTQTINVSFVRLQDMSEYAGFSNLLTCNLCDTIKVIFPDYKTSANFKIVKTVWDVLSDRYDSMELGTLSTTLAEALGITNSLEKQSAYVQPTDYIVEQGTSGVWTYRKWNSGIAECWGTHKYTLTGWSAWGTLYEGSSSGGAYYKEAYPTNLFKERPFSVASVKGIEKGYLLETYTAGDSSQTDGYIVVRPNNTGSLGDVYINIYAMGRWK